MGTGLQARLADHFLRVRRQLGAKVALGRESYIVKGYISNILSVDSPHEKELDNLFAQLLKKDGHFVDVGMNLGQTLGKVLSIDPTRNYVGFEPQVFACAMVARFLADNYLSNCKVMPFGLSNSNDIRRFYSNGLADVSGSLIQVEGSRACEFVPVRVGDEAISELGIEKISAIKIDVEGAELEVLEGLSKTISSMNPPVIFEVIPNFEGDRRDPVASHIAKRRRDSAAKLFEFFTQRNNYVVHQLGDDSKEVPIEKFELDDVNNFSGTNFIARKIV